MAALQSQLKQFEKELGDVAIHGAIQVNVEGFLRLADYWFDNFFTDWAMKSRIEESLNQVRQIRQEIEKLLRRMEQMKYETQRQEAYARQELREWLIDVPLPEA